MEQSSSTPVKHYIPYQWWQAMFCRVLGYQDRVAELLASMPGFRTTQAGSTVVDRQDLLTPSDGSRSLFEFYRLFWKEKEVYINSDGDEVFRDLGKGCLPAGIDIRMDASLEAGLSVAEMETCLHSIADWFIKRMYTVARCLHEQGHVSHVFHRVRHYPCFARVEEFVFIAGTDRDKCFTVTVTYGVDPDIPEKRQEQAEEDCDDDASIASLQSTCSRGDDSSDEDDYDYHAAYGDDEGTYEFQNQSSLYAGFSVQFVPRGPVRDVSAKHLTDFGNKDKPSENLVWKSRQIAPQQGLELSCQEFMDVIASMS